MGLMDTGCSVSLVPKTSRHGWLAAYAGLELSPGGIAPPPAERSLHKALWHGDHAMRGDRQRRMAKGR